MKLSPMKTLTAGALLAVTLLAGGTGAFAQTAKSTAAENPFAVPTTKILCIGRWTAKATADNWKPIVPKEMRETAQLYLDGKIDQWYVQTDLSGVVFIVNASDPAVARAALEKLPLGQAGLMEFEYIPIGPLSPLRTLMMPAPK